MQAPGSTSALLIVRRAMPVLPAENVHGENAGRTRAPLNCAATRGRTTAGRRSSRTTPNLGDSYFQSEVHKFSPRLLLNAFVTADLPRAASSSLHATWQGWFFQSPGASGPRASLALCVTEVPSRGKGRYAAPGVTATAGT